MPIPPGPIHHMRIEHPFDIALAVRGRRKHLKLRQSDLAQASGIGREWLVDLEHGKPTAEIGKVLRTFEALGIELSVLMPRSPPAWTVPLTAEAEARRERLAAHRPPRKPRHDIAPPDDYPRKNLWPGG